MGELSLLLVLSFAPRGFSPGIPVFPSSQKPTFPNFNLIRNGRRGAIMWMSATSKSIFILLFTCSFDLGARAYNKKRNCCIEKIK